MSIMVTAGVVSQTNQLNVWIQDGFKTEWTTTVSNETITLPLSSGIDSSFNCMVYWGDGTTSVIRSATSANRIHTYAVAGTYVIEIIGICEGFSFNNSGDKLKLKKILSWGNPLGFKGFKYLTSAFYGCANLTTIAAGSIISSGSGCLDFNSTFKYCSSLVSIPADIFRYHTSVSANAFYDTFNGCNGASLTTIPADLFRYNTAVSTNGFYQTFSGCALTIIPADLFRYNTSVSSSGFFGTFSYCKFTSIPASTFDYNILVSDSAFANTFLYCNLLTSIPVNLFRYNTLAASGAFYRTFFYGEKISSISTDLFRYNTNVTNNGFESTFTSAKLITSIPADLFRYNTSVSASAFSSTFQSCIKLATVPTDLFRYNTSVSVSAFQQAFYGCTLLESVPNDLFRYNTSVSSGGFLSTFQNCPKLRLNKWIFFASGEEGTRFLNRESNFTMCFTRSSFSGIQGSAPVLWNCSFGTATPITTGCYSGNGNSLTSLDNYASIPTAWKT